MQKIIDKTNSTGTTTHVARTGKFILTQSPILLTILNISTKGFEFEQKQATYKAFRKVREKLVLTFPLRKESRLMYLQFLHVVSLYAFEAIQWHLEIIYPPLCPLAQPSICLLSGSLIRLPLKGPL